MGSVLKKHMEWGSCYFQEYKSMDFKELPKLRDSISYIYIDHARVEQDNRSLVFICKDGKVPIPVAALTCIVLGPGTSITHAAVKPHLRMAVRLSGAGMTWIDFMLPGWGRLVVQIIYCSRQNCV